MLKQTPFHLRTAPLVRAQTWRRWAGHEVASAYEPHPDRDATPMPSLLQSAIIEMVYLETHSPARGKLIRELEVRSKTGCSIIGIERNGVSMVNPNADEEFQAGDGVLLLGNNEQLLAGRQLLGASERRTPPAHEA